MLLFDVCEKLYFPLRLRITEATRYQYRIALADFGRFLERPATLDDLSDDAVTRWQVAQLSRGLAPATVRERAGRIATLWRWLAKRGKLSRWPSFETPAVPESSPEAFTEEQLRAIFHSARKERGRLDLVPCDLWWTSFLAFIWATAERKSAALSVRLDWLDLRGATCRIPAQARKGGRKPAIYHLWPELVPLLAEAVACDTRRVLLWPWPKCKEAFYTSLNRILSDAGIPLHRRRKIHALRVSHATWLRVLGGDATRALMHSDPATTQRHYIDTSKLPPEPQRLFVPWASYSETPTHPVGPTLASRSRGGLEFG